MVDSGLSVGVSGGSRDGAVAVADASAVRAVCYQERVTRVRRGGSPTHHLPDEALDLLLAQLGRSRGDVRHWVTAGGRLASTVPDTEALDAHRAYAATAFLSSPLDRALVVVCDREAPGLSVWLGEATRLTPMDRPWRGPAFADLLATCAGWLGLRGDAATTRYEALARLAPAAHDPVFDRLLRLDGDRLVIDPTADAVVVERVAAAGTDVAARAAVASALQRRLVALLVEWLAAVRAVTSATAVCLGGELFYHSPFNTGVRESGLFTDVFVPVDPGVTGQAVGAALTALPGRVPSPSAFLGPSYSRHDIKAVLDNCKLQYTWESEDGAIAAAVRALVSGRLVGWFDGPMEWGRRALGARSILANPFSPYVLENLNRYLKHREPWRGYAISAPTAAVHEHFTGPSRSPFMECDYLPRVPETFAQALPLPDAAVRMHTVDAGGRPRFARLLDAFGAATGKPFLINTSFNGFHEPIVCNPRDAVRVFFGTGLDVLVLDQFVLQK